MSSFAAIIPAGFGWRGLCCAGCFISDEYVRVPAYRFDVLSVARASPYAEDDARYDGAGDDGAYALGDDGAYAQGDDDAADDAYAAERDDDGRV
jgi:hypothetical protein